MKKILVPTDFSIHAERALEVASKLAKENNAELIAMHMMGLMPSELNKSSNQESIEAIFHLKLAEKKFKEFLDKDFLKGVKVTETVSNEKSFQKLNEYIKDHAIDLVVMGSHGTSGFTEDVFVGSNTEKMVRYSEVPVLVVKDNPKDFSFKHVVFACDFKDENTMAYKKAMRLFNNMNAKVDMLYVNTPSKFMTTSEMEEKAEQFLSSINDVNDVVFFNDFSVENGIFNYSKKVGADLIAIPTHGRKGLAHFFVGSIGEDVVNHAKRSVITFRI